MRLTTSALVLGAASSAMALHDQQVLGGSSKLTANFGLDKEFESWALSLKDSFGDLTSEAKATWAEVSMLAPEAVEAFKAYTKNLKPKKHSRKPDSKWDHVVKGADMQKMWVPNEDGEPRRLVGGKLENYSLRVKKVDPRKLGVDTVKQYSGYLDDDEKDKHLFYWFFESRNDPENDPVVLWLNGGPGCSSLTGLFMELGPASINKKIEVVNNPYAWNNNASVIFLDQPVNVGYSYGSGTVSDSVAAGKDIYALLTLFFHEFPQYAKQAFHMAGESYGGHYVPTFAAEILSHKDRNINLQSIAIGNGLTDGLIQYAHYRPMACGDGGYPAILGESECTSMDKALPRCQSLIQSCYNSQSAWICVVAVIYCNNAFIAPYQRTGANPYDVRRKCEDTENLCYEELGYISEWLNRPSTLDAVGAEVGSYGSCNTDVSRDFMSTGDWMKPVHLLIPKILEDIPVLLYAGDADFICNWLGNRAWANALEWKGGEEFRKAKTHPLYVGDDKEYGNVKTHNNLTWIQVYQAGHMTPMDEPEGSLDFINRWIAGEWVA